MDGPGAPCTAPGRHQRPRRPYQYPSRLRQMSIAALLALALVLTAAPGRAAQQAAAVAFRAVPSPPSSRPRPSAAVSAAQAAADRPADEQPAQPALRRFVPTADWQDVADDVALPRGLHVSIDLSTGRKRARLPPVDETRATVVDGNSTAPAPVRLELGDRLRRLSDADMAEAAAAAAAAGAALAAARLSAAAGQSSDSKRHAGAEAQGLETPDAAELLTATSSSSATAATAVKVAEAVRRARASRRAAATAGTAVLRESSTADATAPASGAATGATRTELDDVIAILGGQPRAPRTEYTDASRIYDLAAKIADNEVAANERLSDLATLEELVHGFENARDFAAVGGLAALLRLLDDRSGDIRSAAALALGAAVQNNPDIQLELLPLRVIERLVGAATGDPVETVQKRAIFVLSALTRHCAEATEILVSSGGLSRLVGMLRAVRPSQAVQRKLLTLLTDLLTLQVRCSADRMCARMTARARN